MSIILQPAILQPLKLISRHHPSTKPLTNCPSKMPPHRPFLMRRPIPWSTLSSIPPLLIILYCPKHKYIPSINPDASIGKGSYVFSSTSTIKMLCIYSILKNNGPSLFQAPSGVLVSWNLSYTGGSSWVISNLPSGTELNNYTRAVSNTLILSSLSSSLFLNFVLISL